MSDLAVSAVSLFLTVLILSAGLLGSLYRFGLLILYLLTPAALLLAAFVSAAGDAAALVHLRQMLFPAAAGYAVGLSIGISRLRVRGIFLTSRDFLCLLPSDEDDEPDDE